MQEKHHTFPQLIYPLPMFQRGRGAHDSLFRRISIEQVDQTYRFHRVTRVTGGFEVAALGQVFGCGLECFGR
jgi:hypothetical protein